jgi:hypothetical protein
MKHQRRFAPKGGRIESELVAGFVGISNYLKHTDWESCIGI